MKRNPDLRWAIGRASGSAMACYTVYDRNNNVVYNAQTAPVDMSRHLHETVPAAFPGGTMVFDASSTNRPRDMPVRLSLPVPPSKPSPLLTDRRTAAEMNAPHTILPSGVALISQPTAVMTRGLSVYSTSSSAPVAMATAIVVPQRKPHAETVITELHNPPLTVVQQGGMVVSELR